MTARASGGTPKVSVIIPAYNAEAYLREAIDSALAQTGVDFEVILVDDGSTDGTASIARSYGERVIYHYRPNGGVAEALNTGISLARGEYVALLGADDLLKPESLAVRATTLDRFPAAAFVHGGAYEIDENGAVLRLRGATKGQPHCEPSDQAFQRLLKGNHVICSTVMARRRHLLATGGFNQSFVPGEDWAVWLQMAANSDVAYIPTPLADYRIHPSSLVGRLPFEAYETAHQRVLDELFSGEALGPYRSFRQQAYASHHRRMALMAAYLRQRRSFLPYLLNSLRMRPELILEAETWKTFYFGLRLLLPSRLLDVLRRFKSRARTRRGPDQTATSATR